MTPKNRAAPFLSLRIPAVFGMLVPAVVVAFVLPTSARANPIPLSIACGPSSPLVQLGLCASGTTGFENIQMNFVGSEDAPESDVDFSPVSYFATYTPRAVTPTTNDVDPVISPSPSPTPTTDSGPIITSNLSTTTHTSVATFATTNTNTSPHVFASTLAPAADPPAVVPEPRYSVVALFGAGLIALFLRRRHQRSQSF